MSKLHPLTAYRALHELTRQQLADKLGLSVVTITSYENGHRRIGPENAVAIEGRIGIDRAILRPDLFKRAA
jgi:transcriptional regulator with XRE-family HTH domain